MQFYQATSTGVISHEHVSAIASQIDKVYAKGDYVGSLVVPERRSRPRPTSWTRKPRPTTPIATPEPTRWRDFPGLVERYRKYGHHWAFGLLGAARW